jgi:hypothetical protein
MGYAGREFAEQTAERDVTFLRPRRQDETAGPHLAPIRQRIESIFWTAKDILTLERHGARTLQGLRERVLQLFWASLPRSPSTTNSERNSRALSTTAPNHVESTN